MYPSIPMAFYWSYLTFIYLGIPWFFYGFVPYLTDRRIIWDMLIYSSICLSLFLLGFIFVKKILKLSSKLQPRQIINDVQVSIAAPFILLVLSIIVFILYVSKLEVLPIALVLEGITDANARIDATRFFPGKFHWYSLWFSNILPFVSFYFFIIYIMSPQKKWRLSLFLTSFLFSSFGLLANLEKYPFLIYISALLFAYLIWKDKLISKKMVLSGIVFILLYLFITVVFFMGAKTEESLISPIIMGLGRIFTGQLVPLYIYFELVPDQIYYLFGQTFPNPMGIFPMTPFDLPHEAMAYYNSNYMGRVSYGGNMPTVFWAEMYANFGMPIACFISFCVGVFLCIIQYIMTKGRKTPLRTALICWMIIHFQQLTIKGGSFMFFDIPLYGVLAAAFIIKMTHKSSKNSCRIKIKGGIDMDTSPVKLL